MNKVLTPVLALAAIGGAAFSFLQMNARSAAESAAADRDKRIAALEKSLSDALDAANKAKGDLSTELENVARLKRERDEAKEKSKLVAAAESAGEPKAPAAADPKQQFDIRNIMGNLAKGMDDPEQRKAMKSMNERMISGAYEKVFKQIGLNEGDTKLVSELLGERNFVAMDRGRKLLTSGADPAAIAQVRKDIEATKSEYDTKVKAVIGDDKFRELSTYEQTVGDRRTVDGLAREFERKGQPLEDSQKEKLTAIMVEERLKAPTNEIPDLGGGPGMQVLMSDAETKAKQAEEDALQQRVLARATQAGLSPDQVSTLQESQKRRSEQRVMMQAFGKAFLNPGK